MRKVVCDVRRNELHTLRSEFPTWEIPILKLIHKDQVVEHETIEADNRVLSPEEEYARLERRYGVDKETHVTRVSMVYGMGPLGVQRLAEAMKEELERQAEQDGAGAPEPSEGSHDEEPEERRGRRRAS